MEEYSELQTWQVYTAENLWAIGTIAAKQAGIDSPIMPYSEIFDPKPKDKRTSEEIKQDVLTEIRKRIQKGGENSGYNDPCGKADS